MEITKDLIGYLAGKTGIKQRDLIEKDIHMHPLLAELTGDRHFKTNYVFKGGTCLIKCYLGYYRFSEDLDFSWIDQEVFAGKTEKSTRKYLSEEISTIGRLLEQVAEISGLDFKLEKKGKRYIEFGGSNKFATFKLGYDSIELKTQQLIKIQVNYVEKFKYGFEYLRARNILSGIDAKEFRFLYPEAAKKLLENPAVSSYDMREILAEKIRAILTRQGTKARDFIDVYLIQKQANIKVEDVKTQVIEKTKFMLRYEKYRQNLLQKAVHKPTFRLGDEQKLLLKPLDPGFHEFIKDFNEFLDRLIDKLK